MGKNMSWRTINAILGLATVDEEFCYALLANPLEAVQKRQFDLSRKEQEAFRTVSATNLSDLSQQLMALLHENEIGNRDYTDEG
jgi:hypothetical protein